LGALGGYEHRSGGDREVDMKEGSEMENVVESVKGAARELRSSAEDVGSRQDIPQPMRTVKNLGVTSGMAYMAGVISIGLSLAMWFFRRGGDRETAERLAIFVGLWPPTFMAVGKALEGYEHQGR
jgi:hypothetical protein